MAYCSPPFASEVQSRTAAQPPPAGAETLEQLKRANEALRRELDAARRESAAARELAASQQYYKTIIAADAARRVEDVFTAESLLDACQPDRRGWEWHFLKRSLHRELVTFDGKNCVAFSPDGTRIATGWEENTISICDASLGREVLRLSGHTQPVTAVAYFADGKRLVSASGDKTVRIWDAATGKELRALAGHASEILALALGSDGKRVFSVGKDGTVLFRDADSGQSTLTFSLGKRELKAAAIRADGKYLACGVGNSIEVWDLPAGKVAYTLDRYVSGERAIAFSPDDQFVAAASGWQVEVWKASNGKPMGTLAESKRSIHCLAFGPDFAIATTEEVYDEVPGVVRFPSYGQEACVSRPQGVDPGHCLRPRRRSNRHGRQGRAG